MTRPGTWSTSTSATSPRTWPSGSPAGRAGRTASILGADSLRYLPLDALARSIGLPAERLCRACVTGDYPTRKGEQLYQLALRDRNGNGTIRTYEQVVEPACVRS